MVYPIVDAEFEVWERGQVALTTWLNPARPHFIGMHPFVSFSSQFAKTINLLTWFLAWDTLNPVNDCQLAL